ncbi:hypothetical protein OsJ_28922 [Oryza sativa Japonica Group]|uniref:Uncharacterized protein n=1 Tax=Oryza sativa subsp. japonica TaxID=39947 RepID=B9G2Z5_ORYSJ|nr:hypothetical protein OsJ_28922 [Oryza sativa Japonica Group]
MGGSVHEKSLGDPIPHRHALHHPSPRWRRPQAATEIGRLRSAAMDPAAATLFGGRSGSGDPVQRRIRRRQPRLAADPLAATLFEGGSGGGDSEGIDSHGWGADLYPPSLWLGPIRAHGRWIR